MVYKYILTVQVLCIINMFHAVKIMCIFIYLLLTVFYLSMIYCDLNALH